MKRQRLALVLAGAGSLCRRVVAAAEPEMEPFAVISDARADVRLRRLLGKARGRLGQGVTAADADAGPTVDETLERLAQLGWRWTAPGAIDYPAALGHLSDPPLGLFVRGCIPKGPAVAIVGSRSATRYGLAAARLIAEEAGRAGAVVVSGMARGIDTAAHDGALRGGGFTVAVWGTGPDVVYPAENRGLADAIADHGALVTEYPPGHGVRRHHFPQRNRIVAGLVRSVVIVEAAARSGALITARLALDEGRDVLAVPGSIFSDLSVGPNALLRLGARPLLTPRDLLEELGLSRAGPEKAGPEKAGPEKAGPEKAGPENGEPSMTSSPAVPGPAEPESGLLRHLPPGEPVSADDLAERSGEPVESILPRLLQLELEGAITRRDDGYYVRRR